VASCSARSSPWERPPAAAGVFNPIPADVAEDPQDSFVDDDALFAYATVDIAGGRLCVVSGTESPASQSCDRPAWGSAKTVIGLGTTYTLIKGPPLKPGTWRLLAENSIGDTTGFSQPFTVSPCGDCSQEIAAAVVAQWKQRAAQMKVGGDVMCTAWALQESGITKMPGQIRAAHGEVTSLLQRASAYRAGTTSFAATTVPVIAGFGSFPLSFPSPQSAIGSGQDKAMEILKHVVCTTRQMYADIVADPPDPEFQAIASPSFRPIDPLGAPETDAVATSLDRQTGIGDAALTAFERYSGALEAHEGPYVHAQARALGDLSSDLTTEIRASARALRSYATMLDGLEEFNEPVVPDDATMDVLAEVYRRVRVDGFTADELEQLAAQGLDAGEIADVRTHFSLNPRDIPVGRPLADLARDTATRYEGQLEAFDELASEAAAVAGRTNQPPAPDFTVTVRGGLELRTVDLQDASRSADLDPIESVEWDFGDGITATGTPGGQVTHTYALPGVYTVRLTVSDYLTSATTSKTVTVFATQNHRPVAVDDRLAVPKEQGFSVGVLANDSDPDGDALSVVEWSNGAHGTVFCQSTGTCFYTAAPGYLGSDSFSYTISDGRGESATATVTVRVFEPPAPVGLVTISTDFNSPIGIDYHEPTNKVVVSANYPSGLPGNFELIAQDGSHAPFSSIAGLTDELKLATVRSGPCQGGFQAGELFAGTGLFGEIARVSPDGASIARPWVTLPGEFGLLRGSLFQDRYCAFGGDLIAITTAGGVWRISSTGDATRLAQINTHLEGLTTVPNDPARYGPWAGTILAGAENEGRIYAIAPNGTVTHYELGIYPEDIDIVPARENFLGVDFGEGQVKGAPASAFADKVGDIVIAQETPGVLWNVHWNPTLGAFEVSELARVPQWEHVTFAPAGINPLPPTNRPPVAADASATTTAGSPVDIALQASDPDGDALMYAVIDGPAHGTLGQITGRTVTYTPDAGFTGRDSFTFRASDGKLDSNAATVAIDVGSGNRPPVATDVSVSLDEDTSREVTLAASDLDGHAPTFEIVAAPAHGSLGAVSANKVTYTPAPEYNGADSFTFRANDGTADSNLATVSITVRRVNDEPIARDDEAATDEDTALEIPTAELLANDSDLDGDALSVTGVPDAEHGTVEWTGGVVTFTPAPDYHGPGSFRYNVSDGNGGSATARVAVAVNPVNDRPIASDVSVETAEDTAKALTLDAADADADLLAFAIVDGPRHGALSGSGASRTYTPDPDYHGPDSLTFRASDSTASSNVATVQITVTPVNDAPVVADGSITTYKEIGTTIELSGSDRDGDALQFTIGSGPAHGTLTGTAPRLTYTPDAGFVGSDEVRFSVSDGSASSRTATVLIDVVDACTSSGEPGGVFITGHDADSHAGVGLNNITGARNVVRRAVEFVTRGKPQPTMLVVTGTVDPGFGWYDGRIGIVGSGYPAFDVAHAGDAADGVLDLRSIDFGDYDVVVVASDFGGWTRQAEVDVLNARSLDVLRYINGGGGLVAFAESTVADAFGYLPFLVSGEAHDHFESGVTLTPFGEALGLTLADVNGNFSHNMFLADAGMQVVDRDPLGNILTLATLGARLGAHGPCEPSNQPPAANDLSVTTSEGTALELDLPASDPDGDALSYSITSGPAHGSLGALDGAAVTYTPDQDYVGPDSFTYTVSDDALTSAPATVTITVEPAGHAPTTSDAALTTSEDTPREITLEGSDADGDQLSFEVLSGPDHGALSGSGAGRTYTPEGDYHGSDSLTFRVSDGTAFSNTATVSITVTPLNDAPVARDDEAATDEDTAVTIAAAALLGNDSDVDGDSVSVTSVSDAEHGTVALAGGLATFTPAPDYHGAASFRYNVADGNGGSASAHVAVTVRPGNDRPTATDGSVTTDENTAAALVLAANDRDGDTLTYAVISGPSHGKLSGTAPQLTYTPDHDYVGSDNLTFKAGDGALDSNVATVSITIRQVKHDTSTTYSGDGTVQYSDAAGLSARLLDITATPQAPVAGRSIAFTLGTQSATAGPTSATGSASTSLRLNQKPGTVTAVRAAFASDSGYHASQDTKAFSITKEDCTLTYTGALSTLPLANTALAAELGESDASLGDRSGKQVIFTVTDSVGVQRTLSATTDANGRAQTSVALLADVYTVSSRFAGDDYYCDCEPPWTRS
jgi:PKD repeat protein